MMENYKEKYEAALERASRIKDNNTAATPQEIAEQIFPELAESEDERNEKIRKQLINSFDYEMSKYGNVEWEKGISYREVIVWLEKQKEQKPTEWSEEDSFVLEDAITAADLLGNDDKYKESHPNLAKAFRVAKDWLKSLPNRFTFQPKQDWSEEDKKALERAIDCVRSWEIDYCDGDNSISERLKSLRPQPKREWSEDDDAHLKWLCRIVHGRRVHGELSLKEESELGNWIDKWLNHNPQPRWKPSEEQMKAFDMVLTDEAMDDNVHTVLTALKKQLQKLM